jgi:hypothetical protein
MIKVVQLDPNGLCNAKCWYCPVAYGGNPPPNTIIKPYSPLIFEVELISFEKGAAPDMGMIPQGIR